jgi:hypothetical protein
MQSDSPSSSSQRNGGNTPRRENFVEALSAYSRFHRAQHWSGTFGEFLRTVVPGNTRQLARTSHEYLWDMFGWFGRNSTNGEGSGTSVGGGLGCRPALATVAWSTVGRQVNNGHSHQTRSGGIQPHR